MSVITKIKEALLKDNGSFSMVIARLYTLFGRNKIHCTGNNSVSLKGVFLRKCKIHIIGEGNSIQIDPMGKNHLVNCSIIINGNNNTIRLGSNNSLYDCEIVIDDNNGMVSFGSNNKICGKTHLAAIEGSNITIGDGCLFSSNVTFRTGDSHSIISVETNKRINPSKSITVGDRIWLGNNTTILKGVALCNDTIVGTGSMVTKSCDKSNVILAGSPASIVKENIRWETERLSID